MPFGGVDYFQIADLLSDEEKLVSATFRRFVDDEIMPVIGRHFREGTFDTSWPCKLGALGALGANLVGYGCPGLGPVAYGLIMQELERGDSGVRSFASAERSTLPVATRRAASRSADEAGRSWPRSCRGIRAARR